MSRHITVILTENDVPYLAVGELLTEMFDGSHWESSTFNYSGGHVDDTSYDVVNDSNIDEETLMETMSELNSRIVEAPREHLEVEYIDQGCVTERHIKDGISCHSSMPDCTVVDTYLSQVVIGSVHIFLYYIRLA